MARIFFIIKLLILDTYKILRNKTKPGASATFSIKMTIALIGKSTDNSTK